MRVPALAARVLPAVILSMLVQACAADSRTGWTGSIVDSAGVTLVNNPATGVWVTPEWSVDEDLSFGVATGDPDYEFGRITDLAVGSDGWIYVFDGQARQVRIFDADGEALRRIGRPGSGPGEFGPGASMVVLLPGDTVVVPDVLARRLTAFDADGDVLAEWPTRASEGGVPMAWDALPGGEILYRYFSQDWDGLMVYTRSELPADTLARFDYTLEIPDMRGDPRSGNFRVKTNPLMTMAAWCVLSDGRVALANTNRYQFRIVNPDGTIDRMIRRETGRQAIDDAGAQEIRDLWARRPGVDQLPAGVLDMIELAIPDSMPAFASIAAGPEATLWVQRMAEPAAMNPEGLGAMSYERLGSGVWDVFDRDGRYLGPVAFDYPVRLFAVRDHWLYGVATGPLDEERVVRFRVTETVAGT